MNNILYQTHRWPLFMLLCFGLFGIHVNADSAFEKENKDRKYTKADVLTFDYAAKLYGTNTPPDETGQAFLDYLNDRSSFSEEKEGGSYDLMRVPPGALTNGVWTLQWGFTNTIPVRGDYDGNGFDDLTVWNRASDWSWYIRSIVPAKVITWGIQHGFSGVQPVPGDYNGDGTDDLAVYDPVGTKWYIRPLSGSFILWGYQHGMPGGIPVPGDYDGDGVSDLAIYNPANGYWYILKTTGAIIKWGQQWGYNGAIPVPGDYDGDGIDDLMVFDHSGGKWYGRTVAGQTIVWGLIWGASNFQAVPGKFYGDGKSSFAVVETIGGVQKWYIRGLGSGNLHWDRELGVAGDIPVAGDFEGLGVDYPVAYRPSSGTWRILVDSDLDGLPDAFEMHYWTNRAQTASGDFDSDGLTNLEEYENETNPKVADSDGDGVQDGAEVTYGSDPLDPASFPAGIAGSLSYSGRQQGLYHVEVWQSNVLVRWSSTNVVEFSFENLPTLNTYTIAAYRDSNADGFLTSTEAHSEPLVFALTGSVSGLILTLTDPDEDQDGMPDWWEVLHFGGPTNAVASADADSDGLTNLEEYTVGTDPTDADSDGDGVNDGTEMDEGTDPLDPASFLTGIAGSLSYSGRQPGQYHVEIWQSNVLVRLSVTNVVEFSFENLPTLNTYTIAAYCDSNADGFLTSTEAHSEPLVFALTGSVSGLILTLTDPDEDQDGIPDWWEVLYFGGPTNAVALADTDDDGLTNLEEYTLGTDPIVADSDGDGVNDGTERDAGSNPLDPASFPAGIAGSLNYSGRQQGLHHVEIWREDVLVLWSATNLAEFSFEDLPTLNINRIVAYIDSNTNGWMDSTEAKSEPLVFALTGSVSGLILTLADPDEDQDSIPDWWEVLYFGGPTNAVALADTDDDGLTNLEEYTLGTDPFNWDVDGDLLSDGAEVYHYETDPTQWDSRISGVSDAITMHFADSSEGYLMQYIGNSTTGECYNMTVSGTTTGSVYDLFSTTTTFDDKPRITVLNRRVPGGEGTMMFQDCEGITGRVYAIGLADDVDADSLGDAFEVLVLGTSPNKGDTSGNGISDANEDFDSDGLSNAEEYLNGTNPWNPDSDGDGFSDGVEAFLGTDPLDPYSEPSLLDSDSDGLLDWWEVTHFGGLQVGPEEDSDEDGLSALQEYLLGTRPNLNDSSGDGISDGAAVMAGRNPLHSALDDTVATLSYEYDELDRMVTVYSPVQALNLTHDDAGNISSHAVDGGAE